MARHDDSDACFACQACGSSSGVGGVEVQVECRCFHCSLLIVGQARLSVKVSAMRNFIMPRCIEKEWGSLDLGEGKSCEIGIRQPC